MIIKIKPLELLLKAEPIFTVVSLMAYMGCVMPLVLTNGASEGDGVDIRSFSFAPLNFLYLLNYCITFILLALRWKKSLHFATQDWVFIGLTLMIPLSYLWSAKPEETFTGSVGMIGTILFGVYFASRYTLKEQLNLLGWTFGATIILSLIFIILLPKYGIMGGIHAGIPRGVFTHKNGFGKYMVLSNTLFWILMRVNGSNNLYPMIGAIASIAMILLSTSTGALLNGFILLAIVLYSQVFELKAHLFFPIIILSLLIIYAFSFWALDLAAIVLDYFGKDLTLTGRTDIWPLSLDKILERPWTGYGFNGFWHGLNGESAYIIRAKRWGVPDSHNGFLDLMLDLGFVGLSLFALTFWTTLTKIYWLSRETFVWSYTWIFVFLAYLIVVNFSETSLIAQNSIFWILYTTAVLSTSAEFYRVFGTSSVFKLSQLDHLEGKLDKVSNQEITKVSSPG